MLKVTILCILVLISFNTSFSGTEYSIEIANTEKISSHALEFDVFIKAKTTQFELTSYQCAFSFNNAISNNPSFSFAYINGSSQFISIPPEAGIGVNNADGKLKLTFASLPGSEYIPTNYVKIGRFRLNTIGVFNDQPPDIKWSFSGKIITILTGANFNEITDSSYHSEGNYIQLKIFNVVASATTENAPEKTIDGKGVNDGDPNSYWAAEPMPEYLIFDLGVTKNISRTKFSFGSWNEGRIYQYSIATSKDMNNWDTVVTNDSSSLTEWTVNAIDTDARYVKLIFLSNNDNNWATFWEAQIYGSSDSSEINLTERKPMVNIPLRIGDGAGHSYTLFVGIDSTACDGLDSCLGEVEFPQPQNSTFSAWLNVPNTQLLTLRDYRYGSMAGNFLYTYQLQYQRGNANKIVVHWTIPIATKLRVQDIITGNIVDTVFYPGSDSLVINNPSGFYKLNLTVTYLSRILPAELTSLHGEIVNEAVELNWKTATELNNKGFEIERKIPQSTIWEAIGFVNGKGTSTNSSSYKFVDNLKSLAINGIICYRLKLINFNGKAIYSDEIKVRVDLTPKDFVLYQNYPNPFNPSTNIKYALPYESNVNITIYNALGQRIREFEQGIKEAGNYDITWQANNEASGIYFCTITARTTDGKNNFRKARKMILLK